MHKGSCLCNAVTFQIDNDKPLPPISACHCSKCRKWTSHFLADTEVPRTSLVIQGAENIRWYNSSEKVRRGFCANCGSSLFFDPIDQQKHHWIGVSMGAFDTPTNAKLALHIYTRDKGDYYEICDGVTQNEQ